MTDAGDRPTLSGVQFHTVRQLARAVAMRPEVRLPLGVAFLRAGANLMVVPSTVFGALLGAVNGRAGRAEALRAAAGDDAPDA